MSAKHETGQRCGSKIGNFNDSCAIAAFFLRGPMKSRMKIPADLNAILECNVDVQRVVLLFRQAAVSHIVEFELITAISRAE